MRKLQPSSQPAQRDPEHFGAFMADGSYFREAKREQRGATDRLVRQMVLKRGAFGFDPQTAAEGVRLTNLTGAFPNHAQWSSVHELAHPGAALWPFAVTTTAAEEFVKRCGLGVRGPSNEPRHWCGELWVAGDEKSCINSACRERSTPEYVHEKLARILAALPAALGSEPRRRRPVAEILSPSTAPDQGPFFTEQQVAEAKRIAREAIAAEVAAP